MIPPPNGNTSQTIAFILANFQMASSHWFSYGAGNFVRTTLPVEKQSHAKLVLKYNDDDFNDNDNK